MKKTVPQFLLVLLALIAPATGMAATVTMTASTVNDPTTGVSNLTVQQGETFYVFVEADVPNTFAATMGLAFDANRVAYQTGAALPPWNVFVKNDNVSDSIPGNEENPDVFDVETPTATAANPGVYDVAVLTFEALATAPGGSTGILINDDGGNISGWFDADTADYIPNDYTQATITIQGSGAVITVTDESVPFGDVAASAGGLSTASRVVTVTNNGSQDLVISGVAQTDGLTAPFAFGASADPCPGATLPALADCTIVVNFTPLATGAVNDSFEIQSNDPNRPSVTVAVSGTGIAAIYVTDSVDPGDDSQVPFGSRVQSGTYTEFVTVANRKSVGLAIGQISLRNTPPGGFSVVNDECSSTVVPAMGDCTFQIQFQPTAVTAYSDTLDIPTDDPDLPTASVEVSGTGVALQVPDISVTDAVGAANDLSVDFGEVHILATPEQIVTVTNNGAAPLVLGAVGAITPPGIFTRTADNCSGQSLDPGDSCTIIVEFSPDEVIAYNATFNILSNDPDQPSVTVALSGSGLPALSDGGSSAVDPATLLVLGLGGLAALRGRRKPLRRRLRQG